MMTGIFNSPAFSHIKSRRSSSTVTLLPLQIKELEEKLSYIRDLLSSKQIEPAGLGK
jgi:hypothetical protein